MSTQIDVFAIASPTSRHWQQCGSHRRCDKAMIVPTHSLPVVRQAQLLDLSHSSVYYPNTRRRRRRTPTSR